MFSHVIKTISHSFILNLMDFLYKYEFILLNLLESQHNVYLTRGLLKLIVFLINFIFKEINFFFNKLNGNKETINLKRFTESLRDFVSVILFITILASLYSYVLIAYINKNIYLWLVFYLIFIIWGLYKSYENFCKGKNIKSISSLWKSHFLNFIKVFVVFCLLNCDNYIEQQKYITFLFFIVLITYNSKNLDLINKTYRFLKYYKKRKN